MRSQPESVGRILKICLCGTLPLTCVLVFGCAASAQTVRSSSSTTQMITSNWQQFFSGKTSAKTKILLLQNGSSFKQVIDAQAASSLAQSASAKVLKVSNITNTSAKVNYNVLLAGQVALRNQSGQAIRISGKWLVGAQSFCALLSLEGTKTKACASRS